MNNMMTNTFLFQNCLFVWESIYIIENNFFFICVLTEAQIHSQAKHYWYQTYLHFISDNYFPNIRNNQ